MRAGGCAVQQALTAEAASVIKQAVALAKRRGHAQVTPLHVANTMLAAPSSVLRAACLQSHSHPLQCKALELCFNVALNRLPASAAAGPMMGSHHSHQYPSISNALVAAFKRAQAHQRRGSIENSQQPILAVKIELEQLIISILDDPSVSRVMREAGFSSTQVKANVEEAVSLELSPQNERKITKHNPLAEPPQNDGVSIIIQSLSSSIKRKSLVIVGECVASLENKVKELMNKIDKGSVPHEGLREVKFISIPPLYSFCNLSRDLVEQKMGELTCLVKSLVGKGVVLYLGDLSWVSEYRVNVERERSYYCSLEHMIMEIGRLVDEIGDDHQNGRFWLMGVASFQTYMRCRTGNHSLEAVWGLHPVTIPANSLGLTIISQSDEHNGTRDGRAENGEVTVTLTCCADCSSKFEAEARDMQMASISNTNEPTMSRLPPWLMDQNRRPCNDDQNCDSMGELRKKWNSYCNSVHKQPISLERTLTLSSASPSSSTSCFSFEQLNPNPHQTHFPLPEPICKDPKNTFYSNPNSPSSSDIMDTGHPQKFKEFNAQNLNILCDALEKKVPWQRDIIPEIAGAVLQCRSGMLKRKEKVKGSDIDVKEETWLLFLGLDAQAKEKISRELAKVVFGSYSNIVSIGINSPILEDYGKKRGRDEQSCSGYIERFAKAVSLNSHRVFLVQDFEQADYGSKMAIKRATERGRISCESGEEVSLCDAIVVLSCERLGSGSRENGSGGGEEERSDCVTLDLNICFDDDCVENQYIDDVGILENVDRSVVFKVQEL